METIGMGKKVQEHIPHQGLSFKVQALKYQRKSPILYLAARLVSTTPLNRKLTSKGHFGCVSKKKCIIFKR